MGSPNGTDIKCLFAVITTGLCRSRTMQFTIQMIFVRMSDDCPDYQSDRRRGQSNKSNQDRGVQIIGLTKQRHVGQYDNSPGKSPYAQPFKRTEKVITRPNPLNGRGWESPGDL